MTILTADEITTLHAVYSEGCADPLDQCLAAAREGRLYRVDTQNRGADALVAVGVGEGADEALAVVAIHEEPDLCAEHDGGAAGWAEERRWSAERIVLA